MYSNQILGITAIAISTFIFGLFSYMVYHSSILFDLKVFLISFFIVLGFIIDILGYYLFKLPKSMKLEEIEKEIELRLKNRQDTRIQ
ncbi:hypothetical protein [Acidianus manzaensis]|uniref:Uncharacterized protein n=1 Tax=Acidianus manzaensis TaxID=282676 RepID=A0A1W6JWH8_9CREN|nr:hypothetical protein [Acidianus manzaensis]ARM74646.1 hypothetical protein B6F84_00470 [Acidianus manzaensis]